MNIPLKLIGYWLGEPSQNWPDIQAFIDKKMDSHQKTKVVAYLANKGVKCNVFMGISRCRICDCPNGNSERTDGVYLWPEGLAHYVLEHNVKLPQEFIDHVLAVHSDPPFNNLSSGLYVAGEQTDVNWWRQQTGFSSARSSYNPVLSFELLDVGIFRKVKDQNQLIDKTNQIPLKKGLVFGYRFRIKNLTTSKKCNPNDIIWDAQIIRPDGSLSVGDIDPLTFTTENGETTGFHNHQFTQVFEMKSGTWKFKLFWGSDGYHEVAFDVIDTS